MPTDSMFLIAVEPRSGRRFELQIEDGQRFVLGRQPDAASVPDLGGEAQVAELALGKLDGTVSRTHAWGERRGQQLSVRRIEPEPGKLTPHPLTSLSVHREILPDLITLSPGQAFGIHREGWFEFHWVDDPEKVPTIHRALQGTMDDIPSEEVAIGEEGDTRPPSLAAADPELAKDLRRIRDELPDLLASWSSPEDLFTRVAAFLRRSLPAQRRVAVAFLAIDAVQAGESGVGFSRLNAVSDDEDGFRPSERMLREQFLGTSAVRGVPRVKVAGRSNRGGAAAAATDPPSVSLDYAYDWIATIPVGARRREAGGGSVAFQPCLHNGRPVCLYLETRESIDFAPDKLLPFLALVTSLVTAVLQADQDQQRRLRSESESAELLDRYRSFFSPAEQRSIEKQGDGDGDASPTVTTIEEAVLIRFSLGKDLPADRRLRILEVATAAIESGGGAICESAVLDLSGVWGWPNDTGGEVNSAELLRAAVGAIDRVVVELGRRPEGLKSLRISVACGPFEVTVARFGRRRYRCFEGPLPAFGQCARAVMGLPGIIVVMNDLAARRVLELAPERLVRRLGMAQQDAGSPVVLHELVIPRDLGGTGKAPGQLGMDQESREIYEQSLDLFMQGDAPACVEKLSMLNDDVLGADGASGLLLSRARRLAVEVSEDGGAGEAEDAGILFADGAFDP